VMNLVKFSKEFLFSFLRTVFASLFLLKKIFVQQQVKNIAFKI
jgi:hypothetical protein